MIDPSKIKVITFDLGNVLLPFSRWKAVFNIARVSGRSPFRVAFYFLVSRVWQGFDAGNYTVSEFYKRVQKDLDLDVSEEIFCNAFKDIFRENHQVIATLPILKKRYKLFVLSDINPLHKKYLQEKYSFFSHFEQFVASYEVKAKKPSPKMYATVIRHSGALPHEIVFIDDKYSNVAGARKRGINAIHFRSESQLLADLKRFGLLNGEETAQTWCQGQVLT